MTLRKSLLCFLILATVYSSKFVQAEVQKNTVWPGQDWVLETKYAVKNSHIQTELENFLFPKNLSPTAPITDTLLIIKQGKIIYERYANGFLPSSPHLAWSVTKSFTNALLGIAVKEGKISLSDSICKYIRAPNPSYCAIQIDHLAHHSSGLDWTEDYEDAKEPKDSAVIAMLYGEGISNIKDFVLDLHKIAFRPGTHWNYSSGDSNLLVAILQEAIGKKDWPQYPWKKLFEPLGMKSVTWESDAQGTFIGSSYIFAPARELARFGYLYLHDGQWQKNRILPANWVKYSTTLAPTMRTTPQHVKPGKVSDIYGAHWWLNLPVPEQKLNAPWPANPKNIFAAIGHWGQYIFVLPEENLVVVRLGNDRKDRLDCNRLLSLVRSFAQ